MVPPYTVHQTLTIKTLMSSQVQAQKLTFPSIQAPASTVYPALFCAKKDRCSSSGARLEAKSLRGTLKRCNLAGEYCVTGDIRASRVLRDGQGSVLTSESCKSG